jgi:anion-transporting  ArsA/GET3 family ATPase
MELNLEQETLVVVVGSGGVGKTTLAAALGLAAARTGRDTLVMTFDPSLRLKDALGVGDEAREREIEVAAGTPGRLHASLLDARQTFDRLVRRYSPDEASAQRILSNRFYEHLAGNLAGVLEYMAVERLFEVAGAGRHDLVVLDTPPTRQALDFLEAPQRIVSFLDSGAIRLALRPWFDEQGRLRASSWVPLVGKSIESFLDRVVGLGLLRDMAEFFQAFGPLYDGFRERAAEVQELLRSRRTLFLLVSGPGGERIPDTMFFARRLSEAGYRVGPLVVNRVHPPCARPDPHAGTFSPAADARRLLHWLGERDRRGLAELRSLLPGTPQCVIELLPDAPTGLDALEEIGGHLVGAPVPGSPSGRRTPASRADSI